MEAMMTVVGKVAVILILIGVGYIITKLGWFTERGASEITTILIKLVTPCLIVNSFLGDTTGLETSEMLLSLVVSGLAIGMALVMSLFTFRKEPSERQKVLRFSVIFSNAGFMGIPLVESIVGGRGVIYGSFFVVMFNVICWTYGYHMMSDGARMNLKTILLNPGIVGLLFGLPIYFFQLKLPALITEPVGFLASLNTPLAMMVIGSYIARVDLHSFVSDMAVYKMALLRLVAAPAVYLLVLLLIRPEPDLLVSSVIQAAAPVAANAVLFAVQYNQDSKLASEAVAVSTVLSIITIPIFTILAQLACQVV